MEDGRRQRYGIAEATATSRLSSRPAARFSADDDSCRLLQPPHPAAEGPKHIRSAQLIKTKAHP